MKVLITSILSLFISVIYGQNKQPIELGIGFAIADNPYLYEDMSHPKDIFTNSGLTNRIHHRRSLCRFFQATSL